MKKDFFIKNRERLIENIENNTVLILFAGQDVCESEDESYPFIVNKNFYYLTGVNEQNDILLIANVEGKIRTEIFINSYDEFNEKWIGRKLFKEEIKELSGIENIAYLEDFQEILEDYCMHNYKFILDNEDCQFKEPLGEARRLSMKLKAKGLEVINAHPIIAKLRMVKQPEEIELIKKSIDITNEGIKALMNNIKPNLYEYQVESFFDQTIKFNGATKTAFKTIAAAGKNSCTLHYSINNTLINDGDLVLFDLGAEYKMYKADISRTIPANGKFTEKQKEIYNIVLKCQKIVFDAIKPGVTTRDLNNIVLKFYMTELKRIGLIKNDNEVRKYYYHGVSHHLGLDTHDVNIGIVPLVEGNVITVEPGLYIPEYDFGIRIEDDALVTKDGCINLSQGIIKDIEDIEKFMLK